MKRWMHNLLAATSMLACLMSSVLWARSYSAFDEFRSGIRGQEWAPVPVRTVYVRFIRGCLELGTLKQQRFEYRDWRPSLLEHEVKYFTVHPAKRDISS